MSSLEEFATAIETGDSSTLELLISNGSVDINARLPRLFQPPALVHAVERGRAEIVGILLRAGARVDDTNERGLTACHAAAQGGDHDVLALLLARQPNLAAVDVNWKTAFDYAVRNVDQDNVDRCALMLLEAGTPLDNVREFYMCRFAVTSTASIRALLDRGVVLRELRSSRGTYTLLHFAASTCRDPDAFDLLVNVCGIDLEARDDDGYTCVHVAVQWDNVFALRWLLSAGADANSVSSDCSTPLHHVTNRESAVTLLAAGASICARDDKGRTAPQMSYLWREFSTVYPFLAAGADLDATDDTGVTARDVFTRRTIDPDQVEVARRDIAKTRIDLVRYRALEFCIGLQSLRLDALQLCEILQFACGRFAPLIPFHIWWKIATTVKHFH